MLFDELLPPQRQPEWAVQRDAPPALLIVPRPSPEGWGSPCFNKLPAEKRGLLTATEVSAP